MAAPNATASSGLTLVLGSLLNKSFTTLRILGISVIPPTKITSSMSPTDNSASLKHLLTGSIVLLMRWSDISSNSSSVNLTFMCLSGVMNGRSTPVSFWNCARRWFRSNTSKSSPPKCVFPLVASTSKTQSSMSRMEMSNVPPPKSNTATVPSGFFLSIPYARAAAVGSLMTRSTSSPANLPAFFVDCLCESLKMRSPISDGEKSSPSLVWTQASPLSCLTIEYGVLWRSFWTSSSSNFLPIKRLVAKNVLCGFTKAWRLAGRPTKVCFSFEIPTMEGVVSPPSSFSRIRAFSPSTTATAELVVPKSTPIT